MGESTTKPEFWLVVMGFIIVITYALLLFGNSLNNNPEITLDADSSVYLDNYTLKLDKVGLVDQATTAADDSDVTNPVKNALGGIKDFFDVFGVLTILSTILTGFWSYVSLAFTLPSFFIETLGLPLNNFKFIVNAVVTVLTLSASIMIVRLTK